MTIQQYTETIPLPSNAPADTKRFTHEDVDLAYSPTTGKCYRLAFAPRSTDLKFTKWNLIKPGTYKGTYTTIKISGYTQKLHRIVAQHFLNNGKPLNSTDCIDHRKHANGTHQQDVLTNLRITSNRGNLANQKGGSSKFAGVSWFARDSKWRAQILINNKAKHIGNFQTESEAARAYIEAGEAQGYDMTVARERFRSVTGYAID